MSIQLALDERRSTPLREGDWLLEISAVLEGTTHVSGIGWRLTSSDGPRPVRSAARRYGRTLVFSELAALRGGLTEASEGGGLRIRVRSPSPLIAALFAANPPERYRRAAATAAAMRPLLARFEAVRFDPPAPADSELTHAVGEALDVGLHRVAEVEQHRVHIMERIVERAREVHLAEREGRWVANDRYHVELDPMRCECPAWTARWARVPIAGRRAARLPCKHIVALALREGIAVPADLATMARKAPG
ncbi:MAG: SWIM zinc finger family protein [Thermoplasmata archaeon]